MPIPLVAIGCIAMVKAGAVMGQYSLKNYDPNRESACLLSFFSCHTHRHVKRAQGYLL